MNGPFATGAPARFQGKTENMSLRHVLLLLLLTFLTASAAWAKLAVFADGRILEVTNATISGDKIELDLPGGGRLIVPATRVERVIDSAMEPPGQPLALPPPGTCSWVWKASPPLPPETPFGAHIAAAARNAGIHPWLLAALVQTESGFDPRARSSVGASGLTQLMPVTAADEHVRDVWDPVENLRAGAHFLRKLLDRFGSLPLALAAYNSGAATVTRAGGIPPYRETRQFIRHVLAIFCPSRTPDRASQPASPQGTTRSSRSRDPQTF